MIKPVSKLVLAAFAMFAVISLAIPGSTYASSPWNAGRIIDDSIFFNKNSMSVNDIQNFLNTRLPVCDTWGTKPSEYGGGTRAQYGASRGYPAPFICLKDYRENTTTKANNLHGGNPGANAKSAAQIIWDVSQQFNISPQALLVMLHKESDRLLVDDWPWSIQYRAAMGYGCPDTGPNFSANCDASYYGFYNQMYNAARQFRLYANNPQNYRYKAGQNNTIQFNPNPECGSSTVFIQNQATAGLYNYTPYQPNSATMSVPIGATAPCGAYGNKNFWYFFNTWFGNTINTRPPTNLNWNYENLDGSTDGINPRSNTVGLDPSTIVFNDILYTFYADVTSGDLVLSYANSSGWNLQVIDGQGGGGGRTTDEVGRKSSAIIYNNELHVFYYNTTNSSLRHAWFNGDLWSYETLDGHIGAVGDSTADIGYGTTAAVYGDSLQLFYYDRSQGNLRHAWFTPSVGWKFENLDGDPGAVGRFNSNVGQSPEAMIYAGGIQLFYYDADYGNLRHAWTTASGWKFENLDGDPGSVGRFNSNVGAYTTATNFAGGIQLFYYDINLGNLRHAWTTASGWKFENLDGDPGSVGRFNSNVGHTPETIVRNNILYVFYRDANSGILRYSWADSGGWKFANMEGGINSDSGSSNNTGFSPAATVYGNTLQLFYFDNTARSLRHTFGTDK